MTLVTTPRKAVAVAACVTFLLGFVLAGYNGASIYVWLTTGKLEIFGRLEDSSGGPVYFAKELTFHFAGCLAGIVLLVLSALEARVVWRSYKQRTFRRRGPDSSI